MGCNSGLKGLILCSVLSEYIGCPTTYQTGISLIILKPDEDIATKQTHTTGTFLFISHTTNVLLFKSRCNIFIGFRIIKQMSGLVGSGAPYILLHNAVACLSVVIQVREKKSKFTGLSLE